MSAAHIFISHVEEDEAVVLELAHGLEKAGHGTWYYERDTAAGASYLIQTREAIVTAQAMVLLISAATLSRPHQVTPEVVRAHESHTPIIPLLIGVTDAEYKRRQPEWEQMIGAATSVAVPEEGVAAILPRILRGLQTLGLTPGAPRLVPAHPSFKLSAKVIVAGVIAGFIILGALANVARALSPAPGSDEFNLYLGFPTVRIANLLANAANGAMAVAILLALSGRRAQTGRAILRAAAAMFAVSLLWLAWVLIGTRGGANWSLVAPADQSRLLVNVIGAGAVGLALPATIYLLYRKPGR